MTRPLSRFALSCLFLAACADLEVGEQTAPIVGGTATGEYPAVPFLSISVGAGGGGCSGTLVSPRVVLTAAHCFDPAELGGTVTAVSAYFGTTVTASDPSFIEEIPAEDWIYVDDWGFDGRDFALVLLEHDAITEPMPYNSAALSIADQGRSLHLVGWGNTTEGSGAGTKREVDANIQVVDSWLVKYGSPSANTCQGDSGGPGFLRIGGRDVVASVTSWGVEGCLDESGAGRVDRAADWIADFIADRDVPIPPEVAFVEPQAGDVVPPGFDVQVDASDNTRLERIEVWINGEMVTTIPTETPPYIVSTPSIADGPATVEVRAFDNRGDQTSASVDVTVDGSCETSAECGGGFNCEDGTCVANEGVTGDHCTANEDCQNGMCGTVGEESLCTEQCSSADSCPDGHECIDQGYCWPSDDSGGCSVSSSAGAPLWLLALLFLIRRRRENC